MKGYLIIFLHPFLRLEIPANQWNPTYNGDRNTRAIVEQGGEVSEEVRLQKESDSVSAVAMKNRWTH